MSIKIRPLQVTDVTKLVALEEALLHETIGSQMLLEEINHDYAHFMVAEVDKEVRGYIGAWVFGEKAEIINFVVEQEFQHQGLGQMLFAKIIKICHEQGVQELTLEVRENNEQAQKFYQLQGFDVIHIRPQYYHDGTNALVMQRRLK